MKYVPLFEVSVHHNYYEKGCCPDIRIMASAGSEALLHRHRAIVKQQERGVVVIVPVHDNGRPCIPFPAEASASFQLRIEGEEFHLVTDRATMPPLTVDIANLSTLVPSMTPSSYTVEFHAKSVRWVYYVVTNSNSGEVSIVDLHSSPLNFGESNTRDLVATPDDADPIAKQLAARHPTRRRFRFISDTLVTMSEQPRKYLELRIDGTMVQEHLPNPSMGAFARLTSGGDILYNVIEHITQGSTLVAI